MEQVDLILTNGKIYTVDDFFSIHQSVAIKGNKIVAIGTDDKIISKYSPDSLIDLEGKSVFPGFYDAHSHFLGYGKTKRQLNLVGTQSFDEVLERVKEYVKVNDSYWITGRGWDQNDWELKEYPNKKILDELYPDRPVFIKRIDGHAALANQTALELGEITLDTKIDGGIIEVIDGELTGILIDNAVDKVNVKIPEWSNEEKTEALKIAEEDCYKVGLTTVTDAGLDLKDVELIRELYSEGKLSMGLYIMLNPTEENFDKYLREGIIETDQLNIRSFKFYADGALGSRGAKLKMPYNDMNHHDGLLLHDKPYYKSMAIKMYENGFQMNTHCIGDSAVGMILHIYNIQLKGANDKRWRIEHAQVVDPHDFYLFKQSKIIPSVQPIHATSDMYWAEERLGPNRMVGAYAYKDLLDLNGFIATGSDFPVEHINPLYGFYAGVVRKDHAGFPENSFQIENALTRKEALKAMTIWAAYACFEEDKKGSIEIGKLADLVILDQDIMLINLKDIINVQVMMTIKNGKVLYNKKESSISLLHN